MKERRIKVDGLLLNAQTISSVIRHKLSVISHLSKILFLWSFVSRHASSHVELKILLICACAILTDSSHLTEERVHMGDFYPTSDFYPLARQQDLNQMR